MNKLLLFLIAIPVALLYPEHSNAQTKSLFVNDNGLYYANTDTILSGLTAAGISYDMFNARDSLRSPTSAEMQAYPLVIWYCSTDGVGNYLWNATNTDNIDLLVYLETGGKLWLMGTDFLYDRYGGAPDTFAPGDFVYDFLGISDYNIQSYGDDGGLGVPQLDPVELIGNSLPRDTLRWIFSTAWCVDGCTPTGNAVSVYNMGPETYQFYGLSSAVLNRYNYFEGEKELTYLFDPALIDPPGSRIKLFEWSYYSLFMPSPPGVKQFQKNEVSLITGRNVLTDNLQCKIPESAGNKFSVVISDFCGKQIITRANETGKEINIDISSLSAGIYMLTASDDRNIYYQKFIVAR